MRISPLNHHVLALVFEQPSTRTRISFDIAMRQMGGRALTIDSRLAHLDRGETIADTARVLSRYVDGVMLRSPHHDRLTEMAHYADIPVINGLTDKSHPCQIIADILSFEERKGAIQNHKVAWIGDSNNVALSWIEASTLLGFSLHLACPYHSQYNQTALSKAQEKGADIELTTPLESSP